MSREPRAIKEADILWSRQGTSIDVECYSALF